MITSTLCDRPILSTGERDVSRTNFTLIKELSKEINLYT